MNNMPDIYTLIENFAYSAAFCNELELANFINSQITDPNYYFLKDQQWVPYINSRIYHHKSILNQNTKLMNSNQVFNQSTGMNTIKTENINNFSNAENYSPNNYNKSSFPFDNLDDSHIKRKSRFDMGSENSTTLNVQEKNIVTTETLPVGVVATMVANQIKKVKII
jgi:hypothetical protein